MYKRVEKRRRRREEEEELGLNEKMKEVLGMHETDTDESDSSEEDRNGNLAEYDGEDTEEDGGEEDAVAEDEGGTDDELDEYDDEPPMSVVEAIANPFYTISLVSKVKACLVCPGKLLKNRTMMEVHEKSQAHLRRHNRFIEKAGKADPEDDPRSILCKPETSQKVSVPGELSNRAQKRKLKQSVLKAKRDRQKIMRAKAKARKESKKATSASEIPKESSSPRPHKKKRKTEGGPISSDIQGARHSAVSKAKTQETLAKSSRGVQRTEQLQLGEGAKAGKLADASKREEDGKKDHNKSQSETADRKWKRPRSAAAR